MTKRMLSLLLALVMTLSLCVPALAADEFAAEAVTEVEEQAPEAPEAPVAPEAEEPAEEPVVDEPAAEEAPEAVEDEPEMASILPEDAEDLPLLVKLGVVTKEAHWKLYKAVKSADEIMADVKAGVYRETGFQKIVLPTDWTKYDPAEDDLFEGATDAFLKAYDEAKEMLDAVDGAPVDYDVTSSNVEAKATALSDLLPSSSSGSNKLVKTAETTNMTQSALQTLITSNAAQSYTTAPASTNLKATAIFTDSIDVTKNAAWTKAYKTEYLTALKKAIDLVSSYPSNAGEATYAQYKAAAAAIVEALAIETECSKPAASDMGALTSAISKAQTAADNYKGPSKYVLGATDDTLAGLIGRANNLMSGSQGLNGFATGATLYEYNDVIAAIDNALVVKDRTLKIEESTLDTNKENVTVTYSILNVAGSSDSDGNTYKVAYKCGDEWYDSSASSSHKASKDAPEAVELNGFGTDKIAQYPNKYTKEEKIPVFGTTDGTTERKTWAAGDKITVYFYVGDSNYYYTSQTINVSVKYAGPIIKEAKVKTYAAGSVDAPAPTDKGKNLVGYSNFDDKVHAPADPDEITVTLTGDINGYENWVLVTGAGNRVVGGAKASTTSATIKDGSNDAYLVAGSTVKVDLLVNTQENAQEYSSAPKDFVSQHSVMLEVKPLSSWKSVANINKWLDLADDLVQSDYDKVTIARNDIKTVAQAFQTINGDISTIKSYLTSTTYANSKANQEFVITTLKDMITVCGYLQEKTTDLSKMNDLLTKAQDKLAEGDDEYTFDSFYGLKEIVDDANKPSVSSLQSEVDAYVAKLQAAYNALAKEGAVDKTALNKAIADAKALVEADYTPESWATAKPAIDAAVEAAEAVAANENATQAQVTTATNAITAAMAGLEKVKPDEPEGPKAPTANNGTGWVLYDGTWYFFKNSKLVSNYWVGKIDGASQWDSNWYYVGADGKMLTGMQYLDDLHGGYGWYFLQPTNTKQEIGKMLTGYQWVGGQYGECYFSKVSGSSGKCTWSELLGNWNGTTWVK